MANYDITFARSAEKELTDLPVNMVLRARAAINALAVNPRPSGCKKLRNARNRWRVRVGDYRIVYSIYETSFLLTSRPFDIAASFTADLYV